MRSGELAKLLGVSDQTLLNWMKEPGVHKHLSPEALGKAGNVQRIFLESDVLVMNTIRTLRANGTSSWDEIGRILDTDHREREFPQNAMATDMRTIPVPQAKQAAEYAVLIQERDLALRRIDELNAELAKERTEKEKLLREMNELYRTIGRLEGRLETKGNNAEDS